MRALNIQNLGEEAKAYCQRALKILPHDNRLLELQKQIIEGGGPGVQKIIKPGTVKRVLQNSAGYIYCFIIPDDGSKDIYFGESQVEETLRSQLE